MRIVLDTNVLVSGVASEKGPPGELLDLWRRRRYTLLTSDAHLAEVRRILNYPRVLTLVSRDDGIKLLGALRKTAKIVTDLPEVTFSQDPDDNVILATAIAGGADLIISGDKRHMLVLGEVEGIPIISPRDALGKIGKG